MPGQMQLMPGLSGVVGQPSPAGFTAPNPLQSPAGMATANPLLGQMAFGQIPGYPQLPTQVPQPGLLGGLGAFGQANPLLGLGAGSFLNLPGLAAAANPWNPAGR